MDGLAATLAAIAAALLRDRRRDAPPEPRGARRSRSRSLAACLAFLPFNLRRGRPARRSSWATPAARCSASRSRRRPRGELRSPGRRSRRCCCPCSILAVPILDTTLVTIVRLLEGRPIYQGGRDHTSHRLVYHGLSDRRAVILLAAISAALGATSLTYNVIDDAQDHRDRRRADVRAVRPVRAASSRTSSAVRRRPRTGARLPPQTFVVHRRRLVEVLVDCVLVTVSLYGAYVLAARLERHTVAAAVLHRAAAVLLVRAVPRLHPARALPRRLALRRRARRRAHRRRRARLGVRRLRRSSRPRGRAATSRARSSSIDALLCTLLVGASRFWERARVPRRHDAARTGPRRRVARRRRRPQRPQPRARAARDAGRADRRLRRRRPAAVAPAPARRPGRSAAPTRCARIVAGGATRRRPRHDSARAERAARLRRRRLRRKRRRAAASSAARSIRSHGRRSSASGTLTREQRPPATRRLRASRSAPRLPLLHDLRLALPALRLGGLGEPRAVARHGRVRAHAALPCGRDDGTRGAARRSAFVRRRSTST